MASVTFDSRRGTYLVRAYGGADPDTGRERRPSETLPGDASADEIEAAKGRVDELAALMRGGLAHATVGNLVSFYLRVCEQMTEMSPTTIAAYRSYARCHVLPNVGSVPLSRAAPATFSGLYRTLARPKSSGGHGLALTTVEKVHAFLSGCFSRLERDGVIERSPMSGVTPPRARQREAQAILPDDFASLMAAITSALSAPPDGDEGYERRMRAACWWTALHTGCRRGELSGFQTMHLRGSELRVERVLVQPNRTRRPVAKQPKSRASRRTVALDSATARILAEHTALRDAALDRNGVRAGPETPLFCHADGRPFAPDEMSEAFSALARELGLRRGIHLHSLRHTHATYLLEGGENIRAVQERLGHARVNTTLELYGHVLPGRDSEVARAFARASARMSAPATPEPFAPRCPRDGSVCARFEDPEAEGDLDEKAGG